MSVRRAIAALMLFLVSVPFGMLGAALLYERWVIHQEQERLARVADHLAALPQRAEWPTLAAQAGTWVRVFDGEGHVTFDSHTETQAETLSPVARGLNTLFPGDARRVATDAPGLARAPSRPEVLELDDGRALVVRVPRRLDDGRVLVTDTILRRGLRQLVLVKTELMKLVAIQVLVAVALAALLSRLVVRPLETLSARARHFPLEPVADRDLLGRRDELGELARSFNGLVTALDARWKDSVTLAGELTHELKSPLAVIAAAAERLANARDLTPEKRAEWTRLIAEATTRLQRAAEALLDEVKTAARAQQAARSEVDYRALLEGVLDTCRADPRFAEWTFSLELEPAAARAAVDPQSWTTALRNLLDNALVQPSTTRRVLLEVRRVDGGLLSTDVVDFGPGVSEGNREKIFHRFFTQRPEGAPRGTGVGLSIVQAIAQAHGGQLELCPQRAGEGARFRLVHPCFPAAMR